MIMEATMAKKGERLFLDLDGMDDVLGAVKINGDEYEIVEPTGSGFGMMVSIAAKLNTFQDIDAESVEDVEASVGQLVQSMGIAIQQVMPDLPVEVLEELRFGRLLKLFNGVYKAVMAFDAEDALDDEALGERDGSAPALAPVDSTA